VPGSGELTPQGAPADGGAPTPTAVLSYVVRDRKAYVTMNRPGQMNALNRELRGALAQAFQEADADPGVLVVILAGAGGRAFSAGGDLKEMAIGTEGGRDSANPRTGPGPAISARPAVAREGHMPGFDDINNCSKPVIAAIDGYCLAGGMEIALYCDIRLATRKSTFAMPEPKRHLLSGPAFVHLSRMIPLGEALRIELTGDPIDAERAYQIGLVQGLYGDRAALEAAADQMADRISENSPLAVQFLKRIVKEGRDMTVAQHWKFVEMYAFSLERTEDAQEGLRAFTEKRKPEWKMR
jgi:enoyl-CoA hydratase/carnithine racemase